MNEMPTFSKQNSQAGQALVEYVLLLVVAVALILGLMNQLYKPFGDFLQNYMGAYLECLLDAGELPTFGQNAGEGVCASQFKPFTAGAGRPPDPNARGKGSNSRDSQSGADRERVRKSSDNDGGGGGSGSSADSGRSARSGRGFSIGQRTGSDGGGSQNDQVIVEPLPSSRYLKLSNSGNTSVGATGNSGSQGEVITMPIGKTKSRDKKKEKRVEIQSDSGGPNSESKKLVIKPTERKAAAVEEESSNWGLAQYLKIAVIVAIIIAIVLFLGGQILQISKSMEK